MRSVYAFLRISAKKQFALNKRDLGGAYEDAVSSYLENAGLILLKKNYRCRQGEIDLIARDREYFVFIEVKYRRDAAYGSPEEAVDVRKQRRICRAARVFLYQKGLSESCAIRFDVVAVEGETIRWYRNAFPYIG